MKVSRFIRRLDRLGIRHLTDLASVPAVAFNSLGTGPVLDRQEGSESNQRIVFTSGTGVPAIADNNVVITFAQNPVAVWLRGTTSTVKWHADVAGATVTIGSKVAPAVSTQYTLDLLVEF